MNPKRLSITYIVGALTAKGGVERILTRHHITRMMLGEKI